MINDVNVASLSAPGSHTADMHGVGEPGMPGAMGGSALVETLNVFLEGERAGARTARRYAAESADPRITSLMRRVARDEAWCCAILKKHIERLGGQASRRTGVFYEKAVRRRGLRERLDYLNRGQSQVSRSLNELIPAVDDRLLLRDLKMMSRMHERNVKRCEGVNR